MTMNLKMVATTMVALTFACNTQAQSHVLQVNTKKAVAPIQSTMYGLFFEDINYAADGGLYGELVKNRSFEFPQPLMGWQTFGHVTVENDGPSNVAHTTSHSPIPDTASAGQDSSTRDISASEC